MEPNFWQERWRSGQIGFHQTAVDRQLTRHWEHLQVSAGSIFVPLCGKSLDLIWLRNRGLQVTGVELSAVAVESLCLEQGVLACRSSSEAFEQFDSPGLRLLHGDIFRLTPEMLGPVTAVYDRASLIALPPAVRARYADLLTALTSPGTKTLLLTVQYPQHQTNGPPFSVSPVEVETLYGGHHAIQRVETRDILADEAPLRARGVTELQEHTFLLTRK